MLLASLISAALFDDDLLPPMLVMADGKPIEAPIGHLAAIMYDHDGDGLADLAVGTFDTGGVRIYRNVGRPGEPKFSAFKMLEADGKEVRIEAG